MQRRALIIGGSVGGLLAHALLRQAGWSATIFERTDGDLAGRGAGLGISQNLVDILRRIGARFEPSAGSAHDAYVWMDRDESIPFSHHRPTVGSTWPRVYQPLRALVLPQDYRQGANLVRITQEDGAVTAHFADGGQESWCGWCSDKWGIAWQIIPHRLGQLLSDPDGERSVRAFQAMRTMRRIDIQGLEDAVNLA